MSPSPICSNINELQKKGKNCENSIINSIHFLCKIISEDDFLTANYTVLGRDLNKDFLIIPDSFALAPGGGRTQEHRNCHTRSDLQSI